MDTQDNLVWSNLGTCSLVSHFALANILLVMCQLPLFSDLEAHTLSNEIGDVGQVGSGRTGKVGGHFHNIVCACMHRAWWWHSKLACVIPPIQPANVYRTCWASRKWPHQETHISWITNSRSKGLDLWIDLPLRRYDQPSRTNPQTTPWW